MKKYKVIMKAVFWLIGVGVILALDITPIGITWSNSVNSTEALSMIISAFLFDIGWLFWGGFILSQWIEVFPKLEPQTELQCEA